VECGDDQIRVNLVARGDVQGPDSPLALSGAGARRSSVVFMAFNLGRYINGRTLVIERGDTLP
jgi:hypothetical protein